MDDDWRIDLHSAYERLEYFVRTHVVSGEVTFLVGEPGQAEEVTESVVILRAQSSVFDTMLGENWKDKEKIIPLPDCQPKEFRIFLKVK